MIERLKKVLRMMVIVCLIVLATLGIGLTGGAVVLPQERKRKSVDPSPTELVEDHETKAKVNQQAEKRG